MSIQQISVFLENRPGTLNEMTRALAEGGVNLRAISLAETKDFGIARLIADDTKKAQAVLREADFVSSLTPVLAYAIPDERGGLNRLLLAFTDAGINVEYMYSCLTEKSAYMIFRVADADRAEAALRERGLCALDQEGLAL